jgi:hypothetical protein
MSEKELSDVEFKDLWAKSLGSATNVARMSGIAVRNVLRRRRSIERREGIILQGSGRNSPDTGIDFNAEFPDWQELEIKNGLLVTFSDAHLIPHRKSTAHKALVKLVHEMQPDACVDMGDLLDFAAISRHHRIGWDKQYSVKEEVHWAKDCLDEITEAGPKKMKRKKTQGNHDQRFAGHLSNAQNAAAYEGLRGFKLVDHLEGWPVSWAIRVNDDELFVSHRWKGGLHGPFNNTLWAGVSHATGHQHKQQVYPLTDLRGDRWGIDVGCLSAIYSPHFRFMEGRPRNYRSGFCVFRFVNYKLRYPQLVRVIDEQNGLVEYEGRDIQV